MPAPTRALPLHDEIAVRAYELWEKRGRPEGHDVAIWLEAESQLLGTNPEVNQPPGLSGAISSDQASEALSGNKGRRRNRKQPELVTNTSR